MQALILVNGGIPMDQPHATHLAHRARRLGTTVVKAPCTYNANLNAMCLHYKYSVVVSAVKISDNKLSSVGYEVSSQIVI